MQTSLLCTKLQAAMLPPAPLGALQGRTWAEPLSLRATVKTCGARVLLEWPWHPKWCCLTKVLFPRVLSGSSTLVFPQGPITTCHHEPEHVTTGSSMVTKSDSLYSKQPSVSCTVPATEADLRDRAVLPQQQLHFQSPGTLIGRCMTPAHDGPGLLLGRRLNPRLTTVHLRLALAGFSC